jgi:hypothetical protein
VTVASSPCWNSVDSKRSASKTHSPESNAAARCSRPLIHSIVCALCYLRGRFLVSCDCQYHTKNRSLPRVTRLSSRSVNRSEKNKKLPWVSCSLFVSIRASSRALLRFRPQRRWPCNGLLILCNGFVTSLGVVTSTANRGAPRPLSSSLSPTFVEFTHFPKKETTKTTKI